MSQEIQSQPQTPRSAALPFNEQSKGDTETGDESTPVSEMKREHKLLMVVIDGSDNASRAFDAACHFAKDTDTLIICHAVELIGDGNANTLSSGVTAPITVDPQLFQDANANLINNAKKVIGVYKKLCSERGARFEVRHAVLTSKQESAKECVVTFAKGANVDTIFVGTRGLGAIKRLLLGSFSNYLVQNAPCNVMVVK